MAVIYLLLICLFSVLLIKSVSVFVASTTHIAHHLRISPYTVSFFLVALGTSLPEMIVGIASAMENKPLLSLTNVIGSNIALATLIAGLPVLIYREMSTKTINNRKDLQFSFLFAFLPVILALDKTLGRTDGIILLISYVVYSYLSIRKSTNIEALVERLDTSKNLKQFFLFTVALLGLIAFSDGIVKSAIGLSTLLKINIGFIGLSITALGTSLPELTYALKAVKDNRSNEATGDIVGSIIANSTVVLAMTCLITPIVLSTKDAVSLIFLALAIAMFLIFAHTKKAISKREALILTTTYFIFLVVEAWVN